MNFNRNGKSWLRLSELMGVHPRAGDAEVAEGLWDFLLGFHERVNSLDVAFVPVEEEQGSAVVGEEPVQKRGYNRKKRG